MFRFIFLFSLLLLVDNSFAQIFSFAKFSIGDSRIHADLNDFVIHTNHKDVKATWDTESVQWIRNENNLLVPRALLKISIAHNVDQIHIRYHRSTIIPVTKNNISETKIYIDLFNPDIPLIYSGTILLDQIIIEAKAVTDAKSKQLIDYSCSPYNLQLFGIDTEYLSVGCKMNRLGKFGSERPLLEVTLSSTNLRTLNNEKPPYTIYLEDSSPIEIKMKGVDQKILNFRLNATIPDRLHRLKTAIGLGPYIYQSRYKGDVQNSNFAPSVMIYGKFDLTETASFKAFDALLYSKSLFNNSGLYFSYDLADVFDGRVLINALLGFQGLHYRFSKNNPTLFRLIYPQGFEVIYKHAFLENYNLTYGMFLTINSSESYTNSWLRYGNNTFLEFNYIRWGHDTAQIKMWGVSVGLPFVKAF